MADHEASESNKLAYFQAITGLNDADLCNDILAAHGWDLELAVSSITSTASTSSPNPPPPAADADVSVEGGDINGGRDLLPREPPAPPGVVWKLVTLPFYVVSGGLGIVTGAVGLGVWIAGGIISRSLGVLGLLPSRGESSGAGSAAAPLVPPISPAAAEAVDFVADFEREYGSDRKVNFVSEGFMDALQRSRQEFKLLFVYLHSPDHPDTPGFCAGCLCANVLADFVNANFVSWGGNIKRTEGFKMSNSLKASRFPFSGVVMAATNQRIALIQQIEGPMSPDEMIQILQRVIDDSSPTLVTARMEAEERRNNLRLREEQDAAFRAALEADQAREQQRKEEQERLEREAAEAERKLKVEEEAKERAAREAAEKEAALARRRQEKAMSLGPEPEKGPDVTQVLIRFPTGERKERRFPSSTAVRAVYDFVDSLACLGAVKYTLVSNFPRVSYGPEKHALSLREAGLHPQASLFVEAEP